MFLFVDFVYFVKMEMVSGRLFVSFFLVVNIIILWILKWGLVVKGFMVFNKLVVLFC